MKERLIQTGLWKTGERIEPEPDISSAWRIMSRLGYPGRYGGRTQDGLHEYLIVNPRTGSLMTTGKGISVAAAMCEASIAARTLELTSKE